MVQSRVQIENYTLRKPLVFWCLRLTFWKPASTQTAAHQTVGSRCSRFLAEERFPWVQPRQLGADRKQTMVAGASYGGRAAAYAGLTASTADSSHDSRQSGGRLHTCC